MKEKFETDQISSCVFMKQTQLGCSIIPIYIDDLNIIGNSKKFEQSTIYLMK